MNKMLVDPADRTSVYAAIVGYGIWRRAPHLDGDSAWHPVFATRNPKDTFGDRTEFSLTRKGGHTRMYSGDSSDDQGIAELWRTDQADQAVKKLSNSKANLDAWTKLSSKTNGTPGYTSYNYCQNGQCGYDDFVEVDPTNPDVVWLGGSMAYDELATPGQVTRSNGRAVVRSTNAGVSFTDMTDDARTPAAGMHPDQHAIVFDPKNTEASRSSAPTAAWCARTAPSSTSRRTATRATCAKPPTWPTASVPVLDPAADRRPQRRAAHAAVPEPDAEPAEQRQRRHRRHAGQRHVGVHRLADLVRVDRRRRRPVGDRLRRPEPPRAHVLRRGHRRQPPGQRREHVGLRLRAARQLR